MTRFVKLHTVCASRFKYIYHSGGCSLKIGRKFCVHRMCACIRGCGRRHCWKTNSTCFALGFSFVTSSTDQLNHVATMNKTTWQFVLGLFLDWWCHRVCVCNVVHISTFISLRKHTFQTNTKIYDWTHKRAHAHIGIVGIEPELKNERTKQQHMDQSHHQKKMHTNIFHVCLIVLKCAVRTQTNRHRHK